MKHHEPHNSVKDIIKDTSVEAKTLNAIAKIWKPAVTLLVAGTVLAGGFMAYLSLQKHNEKQNQEALFVIQKKLNDKKDEIEKASNKVAVQKEKILTPSELKSQYSEIIAEHTSFIQSHAGSKASYIASIELAGIASEYKDFELARNTLMIAISSASKNELFYGLMHMQLGSVLMDLNLPKEAEAQLILVTENKDQVVFHPQALLRLAGTYIELKEYDQSQKILNRLEKEFPRTSAYEESKGYKKIISLHQGANS
jgi:predicted negative regulator of RcsB-dependent stress response